MDLGLSQRVYVVTGGGRGLGRATADLLVAEGARVVLSGRSQETLDAYQGHPTHVAIKPFMSAVRAGRECMDYVVDKAR